MKHIADWALDLAAQRGASYADARIVDERSRSLATKNGKVGHASDAESQGIGIRAIVDGAWGFAATKELSRPAVEETAARAVAIAKASARVRHAECPARSGKASNRRLDLSLPDRSVYNLGGTQS